MKYGSIAAFLAGALLFLLPFVEVKCNSEVLAKNTGLGLAIGSQFKMTTDLNIGDQKMEVTKPTATTEKAKIFIAATIALGLGVLGFLLSLVSRRRLVINGIIGFAAAACLVVLMFQIKSDVGDQLKDTGDTSNNPFGDFTNSMKPVVVFTIWYYLSIVAFIAAAVLSMMRTGVPVNAPQVAINNPGEQSEFPGAPPTSEER